MFKAKTMSQGPEAGKGRKWRPLLCLALVALMASLTLACGEHSSGPATSTQQPSAVQDGEEASLPDGSISAQASHRKTVVYFFWELGCPHCEEEKPFLEQLAGRYPQLDVRMYEVSHDRGNADLFDKTAKAYGITACCVPVTFIGDFEPIVGYVDSMADDIQDKIEYCLEHGCIDPGEKGEAPVSPTPSPSEDIVRLPIIGEIDLSSMPLYLTTAIIAFVDGFNPCSLWLISLLMGMVISSRSRTKVLLVGSTFLVVTATGYGLFMLGLLSVFRYVGFAGWIRAIVALVALMFAVVNIKDYFWFKRAISFTIPERYMPKIYADMRNIAKGGKSTWAMVVGTAIMALGVVLVELPCTAGFPVIWTGIIAQHNLGILSFVLLFALYLLIYLLDELGVIIPAAVVLKGRWFQEKHGRSLKLVGGMIMLVLGIVMLTEPGLMSDVGMTLLVFGAAIAASLVTVIVHRKVLPRYGIYIGTEKWPQDETGLRHG